MATCAPLTAIARTMVAPRVRDAPVIRQTLPRSACSVAAEGKLGNVGLGLVMVYHISDGGDDDGNLFVIGNAYTMGEIAGQEVEPDLA